LLNEVLGGHSYQKEPPALTLKAHGKLITLHARMIAINALKDEHEVDRVLEWLQCQINETWEKRHEIEPSFEVHRPPVALELLRHLPRTNCGQCGMPTCLVFAMTLAEGGVEPSRCPPLSLEKRHMIAERMGR
jgi:ArsR family metal-binding transcriptional regulator